MSSGSGASNRDILLMPAERVQVSGRTLKTALALVRKRHQKRKRQGSQRQAPVRRRDPGPCFDPDGKPLRAISVCCPELAVAILAKQKRVENRSQPLSPKLFGVWFALHVSIGNSRAVLAGSIPSSRLARSAKEHVCRNWDRSMALKMHQSMKAWRTWDPSQHPHDKMPRGSIVGLVRFRGSHRLRPGERSQNPWALGPHVWEISGVRPLKPIVRGVCGKLMFWYVGKEPSVKKKDMARLVRLVRKAQRQHWLCGFVRDRTRRAKRTPHAL